MLLFSVRYYSQGKLKKAEHQKKKFLWDLTPLLAHISIPSVLE